MILDIISSIVAWVVAFDFTAAAIDPVIAVTTGELVDQVRNFLGPILLLIVSVLALTFLFKRQVSAFLTFLLFAVVIFAIFYAPGIVESLGKSFGEQNETLTWQ